MKFELEIVKFANDVVTTSTCPQDGCPTHQELGPCTSDED